MKEFGTNGGAFENLLHKMIVKGGGSSSIEQKVSKENVVTLQYIERMRFGGKNK